MSEHRCRSCLWFAEPLWPEHRPACMWAPRAAPPWAHQRHYVTAVEAANCKAFEDTFAEVGEHAIKATHSLEEKT